MATFVWSNAHIKIATVDQSDHMQKVTLTYNAEMLDATPMATDATRIRKAGLFDWSIVVELMDDMADADVDDLLFALVGAAAFPMIIKPAQGATGAANPSIRGNAVLEGNPMGGAVGDLATKVLTFQSAGVLSRNDGD